MQELTQTVVVARLPYRAPVLVSLDVQTHTAGGIVNVPESALGFISVS